jgi:uncharacterized protein (TIGR00288 family)
MSSNVVGGAPPHQAPNAAMLIDFDNVTMGIRSDLQEELKNLLSSDIIKGKVAVRRAYADWRRYPQYIVPLTEASIDLIFAPAYGSAKKNATDIRLAIDALELVFTRPEIGTFVLLSGDSDFSSMVIKLKEYGKYVIGVGIRESSSDLLVMNCDEYYSYNALAGLVRNSDEEAVRWDPWELVTEAVQRMKRNGDVMRSDRLKQVMQEIDAQFDEKNLGMPKFSRFVQEAQAKGLVTVTKLENGQLEIGVPAGAAATTEAAPAAAAAPAEGAEVETREAREEREERRGGRRGRRGRGRDREREPRGAEGSDDAAPAAAAAAPVAPAVDSDAPLGSVARVGAVRPPAAAPVAAAPAADAPVVAPPRDMIRVSPENDTIGLSGEKLTRAEAFDLVQRAVASLVKGVQTTTAVKVRKKSFELLGRDSETLAARMFERILRDAHDADVIDLRRRGDDYEVGRVAEAATISDQLAKKEAEIVQEQKAAKIASGTAGPSGLGTRGRAPARGGSRGGPPPELLMVGVVSQSSSAAAAAAAKPVVQSAPSVVAAPVVTAPVVVAPVAEEKPAELKAEAKPARGGKAAAKAPAKAPAKSAARAEPRTSAATKPVKAAKAPAKAAVKTAAKSAPKAPAKAPVKAAAKSAAKAPVKTAAKPAKAPAKAPAKKAAKKAAK